MACLHRVRPKLACNGTRERVINLGYTGRWWKKIESSIRSKNGAHVPHVFVNVFESDRAGWSRRFYRSLRSMVSPCNCVTD